MDELGIVSVNVAQPAVLLRQPNGDVISGIDKDRAWGPARLQVTAPRGPCFKLGIRMGRQAARTAIRPEGMVGWYLRVLVPVHGPLTVADRHPAGVTMAQVHAALQRRDGCSPNWPPWT